MNTSQEVNSAAKSLAAWFAGRIPDSWFDEPVTVVTDRDEILVTGRLSVPNVAVDENSDDESLAVACKSRIGGFREDTREQRIRIASEAEHRFERKVSWTVKCGEVDGAFTTASVPVMTRLRMAQRGTLDTLIDAGVARSRSEALAWCVRLVGQNQEEWISQLRDALTSVEEVRANGPEN